MRRMWIAVALIATTSVSVAHVPAVQAQEVAPEPVARALGTQPKLLLLDEPAEEKMARSPIPPMELA